MAPQSVRSRRGGTTMTPGKMPSWAEAMTAYAEAVATISNIFTAIGIGIATYVTYRAADAWRHVLRNRRIDECLIAIRDFEDALRKVVSLLNEEVNSQVWAAHQELWTGWRDLKQGLYGAWQIQR